MRKSWHKSLMNKTVRLAETHKMNLKVVNESRIAEQICMQGQDME